MIRACKKEMGFEATLQCFTMWVQDEGHYMSRIYRLANFNRPNEQKAQTWSAHNVSKSDLRRIIGKGLGIPSARLLRNRNHFRHWQAGDNVILMELLSFSESKYSISLDDQLNLKRNQINWEKDFLPKKAELFLKNQPFDIYSVFWQPVTFTVW